MNASLQSHKRMHAVILVIMYISSWKVLPLSLIAEVEEWNFLTRTQMQMNLG